AFLPPFLPPFLATISFFLLPLPPPGFRRWPRARLGVLLPEARWLRSFTRSRLWLAEHLVLGCRAAFARLGRAWCRARRVLVGLRRPLAAWGGRTLPGRLLGGTRA